MRSETSADDLPASWYSKRLFRILLLLLVAAVVAALAGAFGIARDYAYLDAASLPGPLGGEYHAPATRLAGRAERKRRNFGVISAGGGIEKLGGWPAGRALCSEM